MIKAIATSLALALSVSVFAVAADQPAPKGKELKAHGASVKLRRRLDLYLRALKAQPAELKGLRAQDDADGIWLMERNPSLRARLELVSVISLRERVALMDGGTYLSPPYAKLPRSFQALMDSALGTDQIDKAEREAYRYSLRVYVSDGAEQLMISQVDPTGRTRSGGSVMPGVKTPDRDNTSLD